MTHHTDDKCLMDAVLSCPHTITHESITLHFSPKQKEGHNALAQLRHRLAAADAAAKAREMEVVGGYRGFGAIDLRSNRPESAVLSCPNSVEFRAGWVER